VENNMNVSKPIAPEAACRMRLRTLEPRHAVFIGIDSDGCVFDSMAAKQERFFFPAIIATWNLEPVADAVRQTAAFVNLHSCWRGRNRFEALLKVFELLSRHPHVRAATTVLPDPAALRRFLACGLPPGNATLRQFAASHPDTEIDRLLAWSEGIDAAIAHALGPVPVFAGAEAALERIARCADAAVISQTPAATLEREWRAAGLIGHVRAIAGQEAGSKAGQLALAAGDGRYAPGRVLMLGDAPGDLQAARAAGARFYPIMPGAEADSWHDFNATVLDRFLAGTYDDAGEAERVRAFEAALPAAPPWECAHG